MSAALQDPAAISVEKASQMLGVCLRTGYAWAKNGTLPTVRVGGRVLVPTHRLKALLDGELEEATT